MRMSHLLPTLLAASAAALCAPTIQAQSVSISELVHSGLDNPRGLRFGPDGYLYVAEGGTGGTNSTMGQCDQVAGAGPYLGSSTGGRISRIDAMGNRTTVTDTFPSSQTAAAAGSLVSGVADVAFIDGTLYALLAGAGCSHGVPANPDGTFTPNGIARVDADGSWKIIADLSAFQKANPVAQPNPGDFEPDGTWWGMVAVRGELYAVEPNHGEVVKVSTTGQISRVVDVSASQGHIVPTTIAQHGVLYFSNLGTFDADQLNQQSVFHLTPSGQLKMDATGFSHVLGLAFDGKARMFVLESSRSDTDPGPVPMTGRLIEVLPNGEQKVLIDSSSGLLFFPTGMTMGPDGALYISNIGFGPPPIGLGQILKVTLPD